MERRDFLKGLGALLAAPAIVHATSLMPVRAYLATIYGDGIHDDSEGISALLRGDNVRNLAGLSRVGNTIDFPAKTFRCHTPIALLGDVRLVGNGAEIRSLSSVAFKISGSNIYLENLVVTSPSHFSHVCQWPLRHQTIS